MISISKNKYLFVFLSIAALLAYGVFVQAVQLPDGTAPSSGGYAVDEFILDPGCSPNDVVFDCYKNIAAPAWLLGGNTGTDGGNADFIGTIDAQDFVIKTGDKEIAKFGQNHNISFGGGNALPGADYAVAFGNTTFARSYGETVFGLFTTDYTPIDTAAFQGGDRLFTIGNGESGAESDAFTILKNGNVAIGVNNFEADADAGVVRLKVNGSLFVGSSNLDWVTGDEAKMFFDPKNNIFRAGSVEGTEWDSGNVGTKSIALGFAETGSGIQAPMASGAHAIAIGSSVVASGDYSTAFGTTTFARSYGETVLGLFTTDYTPTDTAAFADTDRLFIVGNGQSGSESDAFTILKNGSTGIGVNNFEADADAAVGAVRLKVDGKFFVGSSNLDWTTGDEAKMFFDPKNNIFRAGSVEGTEWDGGNLGTKSIALGFADAGSGIQAPMASGAHAIAIGSSVIASGDYATAFGNTTFARSYGETVLGLFTTDYTPTDTGAFDTTDRLFTVGNGTGIGTESDAFTILKNGNVAIGVNNFEADADAATAKLKVGGALFVGDGTGTYGGVGEETKMFFAPAGLVFRAGSVAGTEWDAANLGSKSVAIGYAVAGLYTGPKASGALSVAFGTNTLASGANSFAMGFGAQATSTSAVAIGNSTASGSNSFAISNGIASGARAFAGASATSSASRSFAFGDSSNASAINAIAFSGGIASGQSSFAGSGADATASGAFAFGGGVTTASGIGATAFSDGLASGGNSFALSGGTASGTGTFALGGSAVASNSQSIAMGSSAISSGNNAVAIGQLTNATGFQSISIGDNSTASGSNARTFGHELVAPSASETVVGNSSTLYTPVSTTLWSDLDRLFTVGGGSGSPVRADALTILKNGKVGINIDNFQDTGNQIAPTTAMLQVSGDIATNSNVYAQNVALTSDSRLKKNIQNLPSGLAQINQLRAVEYDMKRDNSHQFGFIAQEVQPIFPQLVVDGGTYLSLNYIGIIPVLTKAVQELDVKISSIDVQVNSLLANQVFLGGLRNWLADATNGIGDFFSKTSHTEKLCVGTVGNETCITKTELDQILSNQIGNYSGNSNDQQSGTIPVSDPTPTPETPPADVVVPEPDPIVETSTPTDPSPVADPVPTPDPITL